MEIQSRHPNCASKQVCCRGLYGRISITFYRYQQSSESLTLYLIRKTALNMGYCEWLIPLDWCAIRIFEWKFIMLRARQIWSRNTLPSDFICLFWSVVLRILGPPSSEWSCQLAYVRRLRDWRKRIHQTHEPVADGWSLNEKLHSQLNHINLSHEDAYQLKPTSDGEREKRASCHHHTVSKHCRVQGVWNWHKPVNWCPISQTVNSRFTGRNDCLKCQVPFLCLSVILLRRFPFSHTGARSQFLPPSSPRGEGWWYEEDDYISRMKNSKPRKIWKSFCEKCRICPQRFVEYFLSKVLCWLSGSMSKVRT